MGKNLFILAILTMSLMACSTKEDVADEREPLKPETPVGKDEWETILPDGGVIERDDITIQFPKGTFSSETKVAVSEVKKGQILGEDEVSKFYQITMPVTTGNSFTVKIKCDEKGEDINAVIHAPAIAVTLQQQLYCDITVKSTYSNGEYQVNIPKFKNGDTNETASFSIGIAHLVSDFSTTTGTRGGGVKTVGNVSWHWTLDNKTYIKYFDNLMKVSDDIRRGLQNIQDLGFRLSDARDVPVHFLQLTKGSGKTKKELSGTFNQSQFTDDWNSITINQDILFNYDGHLNDGEVNSKRTPIHEFLHYYQSDLDPRCCYIKAKTGGEALLLYESGAVWVEKFNDNGTPSSMINNYVTNFSRGLYSIDDIYKSGKDYQSHGYGMGALLEYITTKRSTENFNKNSVIELYNQWIGDTNTLETSFNRSPFEYLKNWVEMPNHKSNLFKDDHYDEFILSLMKGEVLTSYDLTSVAYDDLEYEDYQKGLSEDGEVRYKSVCYPYGCFVMTCTLKGKKFNEKGYFDNKQLVIEQKEKGTQTYALIRTPQGYTQMDGYALYDSPLIIDGKTLESVRKTENYTFKLYLISTNYSNYDKNQSDVTVKLEDAEELDVKITKMTDVRLDGYLKTKEKKSGIDNSSYFGYYSSYYKDADITFTQSSDHIHVESSHYNKDNYEKGESHENKLTISFDITGFKDNFSKCKVENLKFTSKATLIYPQDYEYGLTKNVEERNTIITDMPATETSLYPTVQRYGQEGTFNLGYFKFGGKGKSAFIVKEYNHTQTWNYQSGESITETYIPQNTAEDEITIGIEFEYTTKKK